MSYTGVERRRQGRHDLAGWYGQDRRTRALTTDKPLITGDIGTRCPRFATPFNRAFIPPIVAAAIVIFGVFASYQHNQWSECRQTSGFAACWEAFH
jgi:hypothetical protein